MFGDSDVLKPSEAINKARTEPDMSKTNITGIVEDNGTRNNHEDSIQGQEDQISNVNHSSPGLIFIFI